MLPVIALFFLQAVAPRPIPITEAPFHSENIWLLSHSPTPAGVFCVTGTAPNIRTLKPGMDYLWVGANALRPITIVNGKPQQSFWVDGTVTCTYAYMPGH